MLTLALEVIAEWMVDKFLFDESFYDSRHCWGEVYWQVARNLLLWTDVVTEVFH